MSAPRKVAIVFGTRPETIKLAPLVFAMRQLSAEVEPQIVLTGQHRQMLDQAMGIFGLTADADLNIMTPGQTLTDITCRTLSSMDGVLERLKPDMVVVQGDTSTTFAASLAAFYRRVPVAHVEAGLRTHERYSPFPEELNRCLTGVIANLHFPPTSGSRDNLLREGVAEKAIEVTGNTSIDALRWVLENRQADLRTALGAAAPALEHRRMILMTSHRRENFGDKMRGAFRAIVDVVNRFPDVGVLFPVHPNPNVRREVEAVFAGQPRVHLTEPLDYVSFSHLMKHAHLIVTDSGGVQEEAPTLGKPVVVLRDSTERPEGVAAGTARLVGTDPDKIRDTLNQLLSDEGEYRRMAEAVNPYGDGFAAGRIAARISRHFREQEST
jgi:UDP-N-acetylglucosamine 2-epimerase (non-hydrolysing)